MIVLHAIWTNGALHLWALQGPDEGVAEPRGDSATADRPPPVPAVVAVEELRRLVGDVWDSLLACGAAGVDLTLLLPHREGRLAPVIHADSYLPSEGPTDAHPRLTMPEGRPLTPLALAPVRAPSLMFSPADAIDLLTSVPTFARSDIGIGSSLRYWSRFSALALELMAGQRFVPAVHDAGNGLYRGYWRVVVNDQRTSDRLHTFIVSMPPACRCHVGSEENVQASSLVENFLFATVDALVRRCLEGDELAHALHEQPGESWPLQMRWLRSLVTSDATLEGTLEQREAIWHSVHSWLSKLDPLSVDRAFRTCFRLHPPADGYSSPQRILRPWRLTIHVQATHDAGQVLDAETLTDAQRTDPMILRRPFQFAEARLREDVGRAARHVPMLAPCAAPGGPHECRLTVEEAYRFLRDAAPLLTTEGFGVWLPRWWGDDRPRLRMRLDIHPIESSPNRGAPSLALDALVAYDWRIALGDEGLSTEEISELAKAKQPLVQLRGRWTEVQPADVQAAVSFLKKHRGGRMTVFEALRQFYLADDLETGLPVAVLQASGWVETLLDAKDADAETLPIHPPVGFQGTLRAYQLRGLSWLRFLTRYGLGGCLADDMGLGKTIQLIALWLNEREDGPSPGPTLLVVPMSLVGNWQRETARFAPSLKVMVHHGLERLAGQEFVDEVAGQDVVISTYGLTHRDYEPLAAVAWHRIALDEAQNIKNAASKQSAAIRSLRAVHRVALTGTPVENRLSELWSILDFLNPGYLGGAADFRRRFAVPIERYHDVDRSQRLRQLIRPFVLRRLKDDPDILPDLPDKLEMKVFCNLTREQAALYEAVVSDMLGQIDDAAGIQRRGLILAALVRLKQVCNHPAHFLADASSLAHRSGKCDRLCEMLEEVLAEGHRALIFTQFKKMGDLLQTLLQESLDREMLFLHGGTPQKSRDQMVERFQEARADTPVFILSLKAGGLGLNLTAANHVFHFDRWWNPAVEDQATDRAHRIGQVQRVQVHKFVCIGTLEERIDVLLEQKRNLADNVIGAGEEWLTELSTEGLRDLFELSRDAVAED